CWDLYARVTQWYEEDDARLSHRRDALHDLEHDADPTAAMARAVTDSIVRCHLRTMARLGVEYDLLSWEGDILRLAFWDRAFEILKASGAVRLQADGRLAGCWVMPIDEVGEAGAPPDAGQAGAPPDAGQAGAPDAASGDPDARLKVIVRSNGTVTYVGKDIAYQLWKFGLLGRDFEYAPFRDATRRGGPLWETAPAEPDAGDGKRRPDFGTGARVINVIDARQAYLQRIVRAGLEALGHEDEARDSIHFAYEMVALSAKTAERLGFAGDSQLEMSGRKGIGVKADDLLDQLEAKSRDEILERRGPDGIDGDDEAASEDIGVLARQIAVAALRFFMARATTTRVIAFDIDDATSFEGESGPYLQYSIVRARNIHPILHEQDADLRDARLAVTQVFERSLEALAQILGVPLPERM
ncbi:MAG: hypothetical protein OXU63_17750, partial [Acidobacteriota bacterium]|nr:hypothetical protein [Acidobacteriota bacterium]